VQYHPLFLAIFSPVLVAAAGCGRLGDDVVAMVDPDLGASDGAPSTPDVIDVGAPSFDGADEKGGPADATDSGSPGPDVSVDAPVIPPGDSGPPTSCEGTSPLITIRRINGDTRDNCTGQLAAHTFTHALCTCEDMTISGLLVTESFDSTADAGARGGGAAVGIGGTCPRGLYANIGGSLTIAGDRSFVAAGFVVAGDFKIAGAATLLTQLMVHRDAWLGGRVTTFALAARVERNVYAAPGAGFTGSVTVAGTTTTTPVVVEEPCGCGPEELLDIGGMVSVGAMRHENAKIEGGVDPTRLNDVAPPGITVRLPCGRFFFGRIGGAGAITLRVTGRTAVFVEGNVQATDTFQLQLDPGAELDLFIRGNLVLTGAAQLGDNERPGALRVYVGGTADIALPSGRGISMNLYAPNANVTISAGELFGSVLAKNLTGLTAVRARYDRSVLTPSGQCAATAPEVCDKCQTCNDGLACIDGGCGKCLTDADCCAPFVCDQGTCQQLR